MNAIIRENYEAPVLTHETIEVHLTYLRTGLDAMQAALAVLRDKIDQLSDRVDTKFEKLEARLNSKIDMANELRAGGDAVLGTRIDKLNEKVSKVTDDLAEVKAYRKALFWVLSIVGTGAAGVSIARTFDWI